MKGKLGSTAHSSPSIFRASIVGNDWPHSDFLKATGSGVAVYCKRKVGKILHFTQEGLTKAPRVTHAAPAGIKINLSKPSSPPLPLSRPTSISPQIAVKEETQRRAEWEEERLLRLKSELKGSSDE